MEAKSNQAPGLLIKSKIRKKNNPPCLFSREKQRALFGEEPECYVVNAVGYKRGREHVYAVVQVAEEHDSGKIERHCKKYIPEVFLMPKGERSEKRHTRVARE